MEVSYEPTNVTLPSDFDPRGQNLSLYMPDGTMVTFPIERANMLIHVVSTGCIVYGAQIGATVIMALIVVLITKSKSRRSPIFWLNLASLILAALRALWQVIYWSGPWNDFYRDVAGDYETIPQSAINNSVVSSVWNLLLVITVEASLVFQTNVVCVTMSPLYRGLVVAFSTIVILLVISVKLAVTIHSINWNLNFVYNEDLYLLTNMSMLTEMASILYFCAIFVGKLGWTCWLRRRMGLKQWGPMQIICVCGGCTMLIPSIFAILDAFETETEFLDVGSWTLCITAILLPLSTVWAAASMDDPKPFRFRADSVVNTGTSHSDIEASGVSHNSKSPFANVNAFRKGSAAGTSGTVVEYEGGPEHRGYGAGSKRERREADERSLMGEDVELQDRRGVRVQREYEVQTAPTSSHGRPRGTNEIF